MIDPTYWFNYFFHTDFSEHAAELLAIPEGPLSQADGEYIAAILLDVDQGEHKAEWNDTSAQPLSLLGATVLYVGDNDTLRPTKGTFSKTIGIQLVGVNPGDPGLIYLSFNG